MRVIPEIGMAMRPDSLQHFVQTLSLLISAAPPELFAYLRHRLLESVPPLRRPQHLRLLLRRYLKYPSASRPSRPAHLSGDPAIHQLEATDPCH